MNYMYHAFLTKSAKNMPLMETLGGMGAGLLLGPYNDERQFEQQKRFQQLEIKGQKEMAEFNRRQQMQLWNDTNYDAQRKQLEKAGLSVGLMYGKGGQGGSTNATPGSVTGGQAQRPQDANMGLQIGLQAAMTQAQIELAKSQARKNEVEADKLAGVDTEEAKGRVQSIAWDNKMKEIESRIKDETEQEIIGQIRTASDILIGQAKTALATGNLDQAGYENRLTQIKQDTVEQQLRMAAIKAGIQVDKKTVEVMTQQITNMREDIRKNWRDWEQREKERWVSETMARIAEEVKDFNTGFGAETQRWTNIVTQVAGAAAGMPGGGGKPIGFRY